MKELFDIYFSKHYAWMNSIDINSEESLRNWYRQSNQYLEKEFGKHIGCLD